MKSVVRSLGTGLKNARCSRPRPSSSSSSSEKPWEIEDEDEGRGRGRATTRLLGQVLVSTRRRVLLLLWLLACLLCSTPALNGQDLPPEPAYRYLFVVDLSRAMAKDADAVRRSVHEMILSGFGGRIRPGETFGLWTFNERVNTHHFPPLTWESGRNEEFADHAFRFLNVQRWEKTARIDDMLAEVSRAIPASPALTVFIFSAGPVPMKGTPFGESLAAFYKRITTDPRRPRKPFVTTLASARGDIAHAAVNFVGDPLEVPDPNATKTPAQQAAPRSQPTPVEVPARLTPKAPIVVVAPPPPLLSAGEKPLVAVPELSESPPRSPKGSSESVGSKTQERAEPTAPKAGSAASNVAAQQSTGQDAATLATTPTDAQKASPLAEVRLEPSSPTQPPTEAVAALALPTAAPSRARLVASFVMLGLVALGLAFLAYRVNRSPEPPSLISQSIDRGEQ